MVHGWLNGTEALSRTPTFDVVFIVFSNGFSVMERSEGGGQAEEFDIVKLAEELVKLVGEWVERQRYTKLEAFTQMEESAGHDFFEGFSVKLEGFALKAVVGLAAAAGVVSDLKRKTLGALGEGLKKFFAGAASPSGRDG